MFALEMRLKLQLPSFRHFLKIVVGQTRRLARLALRLSPHLNSSSRPVQEVNVHPEKQRHVLYRAVTRLCMCCVDATAHLTSWTIDVAISV